MPEDNIAAQLKLYCRVQFDTAKESVKVIKFRHSKISYMDDPEIDQIQTKFT